MIQIDPCTELYKEELESLYHYRRKFYRDAGHIQVLTEGRTIRQILEYLVFQVKRLKTNDENILIH